MKRMILCVCAICVIAALLFTAGCVQSGSGGMQPTDKIISYMQEKYGEQFSFITTVGGAIGSDYYTVLLSSERFPDDTIYAGYSQKDGKDVFTDNYTAFCLRDDFVAMAEEMSEAVYGECKVCYSVRQAALPAGFNHYTSLTEYIGVKASGLAYTLFLPPDASLENCEQMLEDLFKSCCSSLCIVDVTVYYVADQAVYDNIDSGNYYETLRQRGWYRASGYFVMDDRYNMTASEWEYADA